MKTIIIKTFKYNEYINNFKFSFEIAFKRLNAVLEVAREANPGRGVDIILPESEVEAGRKYVSLMDGEKILSMDEVLSADLFRVDETPVLVFDEQAFYVSAQLIQKVMGLLGAPSRSFADPEKLAWSFNYHDSLRFFVAPARAVFKHIGMAESSGFQAFQEATLGSSCEKYELEPIDIAAIYQKAVKYNPYPYHFYVEPTSQCNSKCLMCPFHGTKPGISEGRVYLGDGGDNMPLDTFKRVIDEIASIGWSYLPHYRNSMVTAQLRGEPTMAMECKEMFAYVKEKGLRLSFTTNGSLLHKNGLAEFLVDIGIDEIIVSIDGDEEEYQRIRPALNYKQVVNNLQLLRDLRDKKGKGVPMLYTKRVRTTDSSADADKRYIDMFSDIADWCGVGFENYDDFKIEGKGYTGYFFDVEESRRLPCVWATDVSVIKADGKVDLCFGAAEHYIGNVNEKPLLEILLESPLRKSVLEDQSNFCFNNQDFCSHCTSWKHNYHKFYEENGYEVKMNPVLTYWRKKISEPVLKSSSKENVWSRKIKRLFGIQG